MLHIRALTEDDLDDAIYISESAFHAVTSRRPEMRQNLRLQPDGWFLALLDEQPVGLAGAILYGPFAYIGSFSVLPAMQHRGIGKALMQHLLRWLEQQGCATALLDATPDGAALYERFSFVDDDVVVHWERKHTQAPDSLAASTETRHCELLRKEDIVALTTFDAPYFGAGRAALFSLLLMQSPERAIVVRDQNERITGYLFAQERRLGPWVAESASDAALLLANALSLPFADTPAVLAPGCNPHVSALLEQYGFGRARTLRHMRYGNPVLFRRREHLYGLASFTLG